MNYITLKTHSLVTLVGRTAQDSIDWENMGTNSDLIIFDEVKISMFDPATEKIYYILPIANLEQAQIFVQACGTTYDIVAEIVDEATAIARKDAFLASLPVE
jgi:hypothetical protein